MLVLRSTESATMLSDTRTSKELISLELMESPLIRGVSSSTGHSPTAKDSLSERPIGKQLWTMMTTLSFQDILRYSSRKTTNSPSLELLTKRRRKSLKDGLIELTLKQC